MTGPTEPDDDRENDKFRDLVKRALSTEALAREAPDILRGVQRRLRKRSRGKFFARGWSTSQSRQIYVLVALLTLLLAAVAYFGLLPMDVH